MNKPDRKTILLLAFRTYFIRIFYNYNNLFGEGLCYCIFPFFSRSCTSSREEVAAKHMMTFNTNEYLSGFAVGIILKTSESGEGDMERTKNILSSVLGSVGDRLIYRLILPVIALSAANKFIISGFKPDACSIAVIISLVAVFNIFNLWIRYFGISKGYDRGLESLKIFKSPVYTRIVRILTAARNILTALLVINFVIYLKVSNILLFFYN
ncbi:MAG: PTS system mannose/fructose/sorbose family transporter subunit IID [Candidatus Delongbacteria bacterium]|nr:PTS system mannose/fructose/sorbose family transporter subunit IID [Candidatus Delongbacteria bacterium]